MRKCGEGVGMDSGQLISVAGKHFQTQASAKGGSLFCKTWSITYYDSVSYLGTLRMTF